ncbi:hypothetical protein DV738_g3553, partial [Chaetothyriales sp. CBS 135597]
MAKKRKRDDDACCRTRKRSKSATPACRSPRLGAPASLLALYYPTVVSLKDFILSRLPPGSRVKRKKIETVSSVSVHSLLNSTLVGILAPSDPTIQKLRAAELSTFTQTQRASTNKTRPGSTSSQTCTLAEVIDFVVWTLFKRSPRAYSKPRHLLCHGLQRATPAGNNNPDGSSDSLVCAGIVRQHPNPNIDSLKMAPWLDLFQLLGSHADAIFINMLLDSAVFISLSGGSQTYYQLSGIPVSDLKPLPPDGNRSENERAQPIRRRPTTISFARNRILYAKSSLNAKTQVRFGLKHVHVFQRYSHWQDDLETTHIMKYVFPSQFGLPNVFTSALDAQGAGRQPLPDYAYRENDITSSSTHPRFWLPKRLRGGPMDLVRRMRKAHAACSYTQLLRHYCPDTGQQTAWLETKQLPGAPPQASIPLISQSKPFSLLDTPASVDTVSPSTGGSFLPYATPAASVAAFCKSVLVRLLPVYALGYGPAGSQNWHHLLSKVDQFVHARRFETLSLHQVIQHMKIKSVEWLDPHPTRRPQNVSKSDMAKRTEIFYEFIYYVFDSLLIPLIRSNFYVTEAAPSRNRLWYFRHDIWRKLSTPSLAMLRIDMYEPLRSDQVRKILSHRSLGYSQVRLLPKADGTRPIINLRRRLVKSINGTRQLGPSINSQLAPIFSVLNYERSRAPDRLASSLFSTSSLAVRLKEFKARLPKRARLFFVKVDVQACFDTIPQDGLLGLAEQIISSPWYKTTRYAEVRLAEKGVNCRRKFTHLASASTTDPAFSTRIADELVKTKQATIILEAGNARNWQRDQLLRLLHDHVRNNIVKLGKKHMKQKSGIPQGSVLSTLLCNYFYAAFEREKLGFLDSTDSLLLRLTDDFLLITTNKASARRFAETMTQTHPDFGISINVDKSLANFDIHVGHHHIPKHQGRSGFPYCGIMISTTDLQVSKNRKKPPTLVVSHGLTVDTARSTGRAFQNKMVTALKVQLQAMLVDRWLNTRERVMASLMEVIWETAMRMHQYLKAVRAHDRPSPRLVISLVGAFIRLLSRYVNRRHDGLHPQLHSEHAITRKQICWMVAASIEQVLLRKQSAHSQALAWLKSLKTSAAEGIGISSQALHRLVANCTTEFAPIDGISIAAAIHLTCHRRASTAHRRFVSQTDRQQSNHSQTKSSTVDDDGLAIITQPRLSERRTQSFASQATKRPLNSIVVRQPTNGNASSSDNPAQIREAIKDTGLGVSVQKEIRTTAAHSRRGFTSPATSFLTANALPTRPRSSSPPKVGRNGLPSTRLSPDRLRPNWHSPSSRPVSSRTRSFQSNRRRSVQELEAEYHDSDDDLPDDASLWNVPVSPNPGLKSRSPSFCASSGKPSMASSPRPIPLDHHTPHPDTSLGRSPPSQRLPKRRRPQPLRSASLNIPVNAPPRKTERFAHPSRTRSWNTAMSELSEEARILSESLQHHAEIQRLSQMESTPLRSRTDPATMKPKASSIQLPPVQRGNLDFMPISKEKEAILSRTRPSWLPPKDPKEEKKHLKEYQQMMAASLEAEKKRNEQARTRQDRKEVDAECSPDRIWQSYSADTTDLSQIDRRVFSLCWRGVSPNLRARVWQQTIGNELGLNAKSFQLALDRAKDIQSASEQGLLCRERTMRRWLIDIERDAETAFPELGLFQRNAPLWQALIDVCKAYACYRSEIGYVYGLQLVAALILLQTPSTADAFVLLANALNRPAPLAFQSGGLATMTRIYNHAVDTLAIKFPRLHEYLFGSIESGGLGLTPAVIFEPMFKTLFCNGLDVDRLCRVWDIWVFDGDRTLVRTAVAILGGCLQSQIFAITGDIDLKRRNIQEMLAWGPFNRNSRGQHWQLPSEMGEDGFIEEIRLAGRLDYMGK